jgi:uncharacterized repeat protein (TIGR01451 family)
MKTLLMNTKTAVVTLAIIVLPLTAWAKPNITISIKAQKDVVVTENAKQVKKTVEATDIAPGEVITFILSYSNTGDETATSVVISDPIPEGTVFMPGTATEKGDLSFSIDKGKTFKKPSLLVYETTTASGKKEKRVASPEEYTHIRWIIPSIAAGEKGDVSFRVKVK